MTGPDSRDPTSSIEVLRAEIRHHDRLYFVENAPEITDEKYDALMHRLLGLEAEHPELVTADSPTQRVGGQPLEGFESVRHAVAMLSVDNTYSADDLREFDVRVRRLLEDEPFEYVVDPKIDGVAITLRYEDGQLLRAATRGDGRTGDDITANVRTLRSVPLTLAGADLPAVLEVRGEIFWPRPAFERVNDARREAGEEPFKNPRNATAGTLKQLDPRTVAQRGLVFQVHGYGQVDPFPAAVSTQTALFESLRSRGLPTSLHQQTCADIDEVIAFVEAWDQRRRELDYDTDGLVIKLNRLSQRERLGSTSRAPRWCIAYKYPAEQAETRLLSVDFQVGKLGTITPRANLEPVELSGTTVSHATLHNFDQVERLDLHIGDAVTVEKAGEIIPQVIAVDAKKRKRGAQRVSPPDACPECGGDVARDEGGVYLRCLNPDCPARLVERLKFFCGRDQMDIDVAGAVLVERLVESGMVRSYADLYRLREHLDELTELPVSRNRRTGSDISLGAKRAERLIEGIERSRGGSLARLLAALNIRHVGASTAEVLADAFGSLDAVSKAAPDEFQELDGIGPELAESLRNWFDSQVGRETIAELVAVGVNPVQKVVMRSVEGPLAGKTLVVTGALERYARKEIEALIKQKGGKLSSSVSGRTDYLIAGAKAGSKLAKAEKLGVEVLDEAAFDKLIGRAD